MIKEIMVDPIIIQVGFTCLTILVGINAFFIKSLVLKVEKADKSIAKYEEQIRQLNDHIEHFSTFVRDLSDLKSEVAVLKYALDRKGD